MILPPPPPPCTAAAHTHTHIFDTGCAPAGAVPPDHHWAGVGREQRARGPRLQLVEQLEQLARLRRVVDLREAHRRRDDGCATCQGLAAPTAARNDCRAVVFFAAPTAARNDCRAVVFFAAWEPRRRPASPRAGPRSCRTTRGTPRPRAGPGRPGRRTRASACGGTRRGRRRTRRSSAGSRARGRTSPGAWRGGETVHTFFRRLPSGNAAAPTTGQACKSKTAHASCARRTPCAASTRAPTCRGRRSRARTRTAEGGGGARQRVVRRSPLNNDEVTVDGSRPVDLLHLAWPSRPARPDSW